MPKNDDTTGEDAPVKHAGGRPTKYVKSFAKLAFEFALLGHTDDDFARVFEVSARTVNRWKKDQPEFRQAVLRGRDVADAKVAASLYHRALGYSHPETVITTHLGKVTKTAVTKHYPPDSYAAIRWLMNRQPARWRAQPEPSDGAELPAPIAVTVKVVDGRRTDA